MHLVASEQTELFNLRKLRVQDNGGVRYTLMAGDRDIDLNAYIGRQVKLEFSGKIHCVACGRATKKSFNQGHCFPCFKRLASCDRCIVSPEYCHYHLGTCREPDWGEANCMQPHVVYLANSSGLKVGITRGTQVPTRWIDQGAAQALPMLVVPNRLASGQVEVAFKAHVADKTDWRRMLKGEPVAVDLVAERQRLMELCRDAIDSVAGAEPVLDTEPVRFDYPVREYPEKVKSMNPGKTPIIEGQLVGIKGQYLIFDCGVFNARTYAGYELRFSAQ